MYDDWGNEIAVSQNSYLPLDEAPVLDGWISTVVFSDFETWIDDVAAPQFIDPFALVYDPFELPSGWL